MCIDEEQCIPLEHRCDGQKHCRDESDEWHECPVPTPAPYVRKFCWKPNFVQVL